MTGARAPGENPANPRPGEDSPGLCVALHTPLPGFANELWDILKLFYPTVTLQVNPKAEEQKAAEPLVHLFSADEAAWHCAFTFRGSRQEATAPIPQGLEESRRAIVHKRLQKRLCKLTLYSLLKALTGYQPPWGSLTGIRPTRLVYENLNQGLALPQAAEALVADFDVTPPKARLLERIVQVQQTLPLPGPQEVDVYISIPFCRTRCTYCSFPGEALGSQATVDAYLEALFAEMAGTARLMADTSLRLRALYIGGGTPTALSEGDFVRLIQAACALFPSPLEFTVEAGRPDTITPGKLQTLRQYGISRISINPQTMNDETLARIGRSHTAAQVAEAFQLARSMGFANINMDVIAGLPGESEVDFARTMAAIHSLAPDSLTVHTLAIKRSSRLNLLGAQLPPADVAAHMVQLGEEEAQALHMTPYYLYRQKYMAGQQQNVGYARQGAACLYNIDIMEENTSILALGAGGISKRVFPDRELRIERAPNVSNVALYVERASEMLQRKETLFRQ